MIISTEELIRSLQTGKPPVVSTDAVPEPATTPVAVETPLQEIFTENLPLHSDKEARLYGSFCSRVIERLDRCESKVEEWKAITEEFNTGKLVPDLLALKGVRTERALRMWVETYVSSDFDCYALIHQGRATVKGRKVTSEEQAVLLNILLTPRRVKMGTAITRLKQMEMLGMLESPSSQPTLKRWCQDWSTTHPGEWAQAREGSKYVAEKVIKSIIRDQSKLRVGDVFVADGHKLAFDIINPETGKPQRMLLILIIDWASRYPVGAALATSENSQHICVAFRNAFLTWGATPKYVYLDNGKAFRAKLFHGDWEKHDLEDELGGIFPRLGIGVTFAKEYNAQSKIIERFFNTFQEQFERFVTTFRGANVADKPATLMRNEIWMQKMFEGKAPTVEEAIQMMNFYFRRIYGCYPHQGIGNRKPYEVFSSAQIPEDRRVDPTRLHYLMLTAMRRKVNAEGIMLHRLRYYHESLVNYVGQQVNIRFDYAVSTSIMVFDANDSYLCHAELRQTQHPFIHLDEDNPQSITDLRKELKQITKLRQQTLQSTKKFIKQAQESVDVIAHRAPKLVTGDAGVFNTEAMIPAPPPKPLNLEQQGLEAFKQLTASQEAPKEPEEATMQPAVNDSLEPEIDDLPFPQPKRKSFDEMLKAIGIK
jgi:putative transposase